MPHVYFEHVLLQVRQFMTGIKNYLVKHGEGELEDLIERERNQVIGCLIDRFVCI